MPLPGCPSACSQAGSTILPCRIRSLPRAAPGRSCKRAGAWEWSPRRTTRRTRFRARHRSTSTHLEGNSMSTTSTEPHLKRGLSNRHMQLIAIGGAIGTGLFMGSGKTISVGRAVGHLRLHDHRLHAVLRDARDGRVAADQHRSTRPSPTLPATCLARGPRSSRGWTYWFCWVVTGIADVVAIAALRGVLVARICRCGSRRWPASCCCWRLNLPTREAFGETEFWFALIKIVAIGALIVIGLVMVITGFRAPRRHGLLPESLERRRHVPDRLHGLRRRFPDRGVRRSSASSWWVPPPPKPRIRRRTCPRRSTPSRSASSSSTWLPLVVLMAVPPWNAVQRRAIAVRGHVRPGGPCRRRRPRELRGADLGNLVGQLRHLLDLPHDPRPGRGGRCAQAPSRSSPRPRCRATLCCSPACSCWPAWRCSTRGQRGRRLHPGHHHLGAVLHVRLVDHPAQLHRSTASVARNCTRTASSRCPAERSCLTWCWPSSASSSGR